MLALAAWALLLPFRVAALLGLRRTVVVLCLLVLGITGYGIAEDLGLLRHLPPPRPAPAALAAARPSRAALADIPPRYLALYRQAPPRWCPGLGWAVLAAVGKVESDHGRSRAPGVRSGANRAGAAGPMQLGIGGRAGNTWGGRPVQPTRSRPRAGYGTDGNRDGQVSVYDPRDAVPAAARYLCAHGATRPGGLRRALYAYNHSARYVGQVLALARRYQAGSAR